MYDVRNSQDRLSPNRRVPDIRFGSSARDGSKVFISKMHSESEGHGLESPGPGAYDDSHVEIAKASHYLDVVVVIDMLM